MSTPLDLSLAEMANEAPVLRFVKLILFQAIHEKAEQILFELNQLPEKPPVDAASTKTFSITIKTGEKSFNLAPPPESLFDPAMRILLGAADIPYWTKREVSADIETRNPSTRWRLASSDVNRSIHLERIKNTP
jgi:hypothetical protein